MAVSMDEKRAVRRQAIAETAFERGAATARRLLKHAILPSAFAPCLSDPGSDDNEETIGTSDDGELVATFSHGHRAVRLTDGRLEIRRERQ